MLILIMLIPVLIISIGVNIISISIISINNFILIAIRISSFSFAGERGRAPRRRGRDGRPPGSQRRLRPGLLV